MLNVLLLGPRATIPGSLQSGSRDPETEIGCLETELKVHRIQDKKETGLQIILRSLVAPHKEGCSEFQHKFPDRISPIQKQRAHPLRGSIGAL